MYYSIVLGMWDDLRYNKVMEITWTYIWSQILTVVEYGLLGATYFAKKRKLVVVLDTFSMLAGILAYILLGADLGLAMSVVILLANFYYIWDEWYEKIESKRRRKRKLIFGYQIRDYAALGLVLVAIAVLAVWTYDGTPSLLSVAATVIYEISIWQSSTKVYKFLGIPVALCWMLYNGFIFSVAGIVAEGIIFLAAVAGYLRDFWRGRKVKRKRKK